MQETHREGSHQYKMVDVNKADDLHPKYRSCVVARQIKARDHSETSYFAPAPPVESLRTVLSMAVTSMGTHRPSLDPSSPTRSQLSFADVSRAYFNARIDPKEPCYVDLPSELGDDGSNCGLLMRHMYGTRRAADGWQEEYFTMLVQELGVLQGGSSPNLFYHRERDIVCSVHGQDLSSTGPADQLEWLERAIGQRYEITIGPSVGPGPRDAKKLRC